MDDRRLFMFGWSQDIAEKWKAMAEPEPPPPGLSHAAIKSFVVLPNPSLFDGSDHGSYQSMIGLAIQRNHAACDVQIYVTLFGSRLYEWQKIAYRWATDHPHYSLSMEMVDGRNCIVTRAGIDYVVFLFTRRGSVYEQTAYISRDGIRKVMTMTHEPAESN